MPLPFFVKNRVWGGFFLLVSSPKGLRNALFSGKSGCITLQQFLQLLNIGQSAAQLFRHVGGGLVGSYAHRLKGGGFLYESNPSIKNFRKCKWVIPLSSLRVTSGVIEMTYFG